MTSSRGKLVQAPCGSGKTTQIERLSSEHRKRWVDGDQLLEECGVKNRNYFWYPPLVGVGENCESQLSKKVTSFRSQRKEIIECFEKTLVRGVNILYSGNPMLMSTDLIIIPPMEVRWKRLQTRAICGGYIPPRERFEAEEVAYREAIKSGKYKVLEGDIPKLETLVESGY